MLSALLWLGTAAAAPEGGFRHLSAEVNRLQVGLSTEVLNDLGDATILQPKLSVQTGHHLTVGVEVPHLLYLNGPPLYQHGGSVRLQVWTVTQKHRNPDTDSPYWTQVGGELRFPSNAYAWGFSPTTLEGHGMFVLRTQFIPNDRRATFFYGAFGFGGSGLYSNLTVAYSERIGGAWWVTGEADAELSGTDPIGALTGMARYQFGECCDAAAGVNLPLNEEAFTSVQLVGQLRASY